MDYTILTLAILGLFGVLIHNLMKLNTLNKAAKGDINLWQYWKYERFSIALSICVVVVCLIVRTEVKQLEIVGNWLGLAFVAIGYMAQSVIVSVMGKATKLLNTDSDDTKKQQ